PLRRDRPRRGRDSGRAGPARRQSDPGGRGDLSHLDLPHLSAVAEFATSGEAVVCFPPPGGEPPGAGGGYEATRTLTPFAVICLVEGIACTIEFGLTGHRF